MSSISSPGFRRPAPRTDWPAPASPVPAARASPPVLALAPQLRFKFADARGMTRAPSPLACNSARSPSRSAQTSISRFSRSAANDSNPARAADSAWPLRQSRAASFARQLLRCAAPVAPFPASAEAPRSQNPNRIPAIARNRSRRSKAASVPRLLFAKYTPSAVHFPPTSSRILRVSRPLFPNPCFPVRRLYTPPPPGRLEVSGPCAFFSRGGCLSLPADRYRRQAERSGFQAPEVSKVPNKHEEKHAWPLKKK